MRVGKLEQLNSIQDNSLATFLRAIINSIDGNISFEDNMLSQVVKNIQFSTAAKDIAIEHRLGKIPLGFVVINTKEFSYFRRGTNLWTDKRIYVQSAAPTTCDVLIIG